MAIKPLKKKAPSVAALKKKADATFSEFIRRDASRQDGYGFCVTCGVRKFWKELQAGHYEKRGINVLRFDERNVHPQCVGCNVFQAGNYPRYAIFMVNQYGPAILAQLEEESKVLKQWKAFQLQEIIDLYKAKIALLPTFEQ